MNKKVPFAIQISSGLAELRKYRKLTQEELAKALDTTQSAVSRIENGGAIPSWEFISKMVRVLNAEVEITFKPLQVEEQTDRGQSTNDREYICVNCLYKWESELVRSVLQCPQCHQRQGVRNFEYQEMLKAFNEMQQEIRNAPPFRKLPPLRGLKKNTSKMLRLVLESAASTFPRPSLPFSILFRLLEHSRQDPDKPNLK